MEKYNVIIQETAKEQLYEIVRFASEINVQYAKRLKTEIIERIRSLAVFPKACPFFSAEYITRNTFRELIISKKYIVLFEIVDHTVYVEYVIDTRRDYKWLLEEVPHWDNMLNEEKTTYNG